ncbi:MULTISPECIES: hypothetical protein [Streptomyces]|uniref:HEAT repeat domain-containing protein n=1 Tax=Streptomyces venezuelae TaxID=54571 RepID=A0A5P2AYV2_STRVZ|nr:hypothetical protein [Streptomyces venezuelae]QES23216.1 hypothetical protein DEJ46_32215 [Streptomyces venezuelae]
MSSSAHADVTDLLARALEGPDPGAWAELDAQVRGLVRCGSLRPVPGEPLSATPPGQPAVLELALALCAPDGRTREAALPHVARAPALLPLVVIRCADWAEPVRERARALLGAELPGLAPEALTAVASVALREGRRLRGEAARELLTAWLREVPEGRLAPLLAAEDRALRRLAHRVAIERGLLSPARLAAIAATDLDVVVQDVCASAAIAAAGDAVDETVLAPLLASHVGRVRAAGVTALRRGGRAAGAEPFLYDRSALVRACARWALREAGTDPLPLYRAACASGEPTPDFAPTGLAECGDRVADAPALWSLTAHERPRVRASAVVGLRLLDAVRFPRLAPLLDDESPRVVRETRKALAPWDDHLPAVDPTPVPAPRPVPVGVPKDAPVPEPCSWVRRVLGVARRRGTGRG